MIFKFCILGGTGAIGSAIRNILPSSSTLILDSSNCNLAQDKFVPPDVCCDTLIVSVGTFSGLKQFEGNKEVIAESCFLNNFYHLIDSLKPKKIINISSAVLSSISNYSASSPYYSYQLLKSSMESIVNSFVTQLTVNLRPTNIISCHENCNRSGHSIASMYRKVLNADSADIDIWSNEHDWREYLDADDLALLVRDLLRLNGSYTYSVGSGKKTFIFEIAQFIATQLRHDVTLSFSQPHKVGPLPRLIGVPTDLAVEWTPRTCIRTSLAKCLSSWSTSFKL